MKKKQLPMRTETADPVLQTKREVPHLKAVLRRRADQSSPEWRQFWLDLAAGKKNPRRPHVDQSRVVPRMSPEDQAAHDRHIEMMARGQAAPKPIPKESKPPAPPPPGPKMFGPRPPRPGFSR